MKPFVKCSTLMLHFLFVVVLLNEKTYASLPKTNELSKDEIRLIYKEIDLLKDENQKQNVEIATLKELVGSQKNDFNPILNEYSDNRIGDSLDMMDQHSNQKRPVRLLPPSFFRDEKNETANPIRRFYGPPTNCSELSQLGYTLNGYYQVKSTNISDINQVETVYCQFKQPEGIFNPSGNEKRISTSSHSHLPKTGSVGTGVDISATLRSSEKATTLNEKNETANPIRRFYGPSTNCSELSQLGYTLNGYYQVKSTNISDINQVETVYCDFKQQEGIYPSVNEKRISSSHLQPLKNGPIGTGVHFYAVLHEFKKGGTSSTSTLKFNNVALNIGDAYDFKSGIFKAPKSGVYDFFFMGYVDYSGDLFSVSFARNDERVDTTERMSLGKRDTLIKVILELKRGDKIQVKLFRTGIPGPPTALSSLSFSGSLLQEF